MPRVMTAPDDTAAIQRAIDELYSDTDENDTRARRVLFFPAGVYRINGSITIPPYAHLVGEGPDKTIIRQSGGNAPVAVTEDDDGNVFGAIGTAGATLPTQIQIRRHHVQERGSLWWSEHRQRHQGLFQQLQIPRHVRLGRSGQFKFKSGDCEVNDRTALLTDRLQPVPVHQVRETGGHEL
jgi:hypothetical protein